MAMFFGALDWHSGEAEIQRKMQVHDLDNPTVPQLSPQLSNHLQIAPLISLGALDKDGRPWTTLLAGQRPMSQPLGGGIIGIKTPITGKHDPVVEELVGKEASGQVVREEGQGRMVSGLTIDLETRKRVKLFGRMIAGALSTRDDEVTGQQEAIAEMQVVLKIEQSLGNCPKYLNKRRIEPAVAKPELLSKSASLSDEALALLQKADLFFVSSANKDQDMDTNHRGGPAGFLRVASNDASGAVLCWPEYSGNRLYQTLGNLAVYPKAGICVPDFDTGDCLYLTGTTEILIGADASAYLPRSNLCVKLTVTSARFVTQALPFRGVAGEKSPYNPQVRHLASEKPSTRPQNEKLQQAALISQTKLTPTISRFRFSLENAASHTAGQYVTLDLSSHLDIGYSHMRNDDPRSLNDDFVRTFTVSSGPGSPPDPVRQLKDDEFEITMRKVGVVTGFLFKYGGAEQRQSLEVGVKGFGGEFELQQNGTETIAFIAAGVGITPILPSLAVLDHTRLELLWTVRSQDTPLVADVVDQHPKLSESLVVFITDAKEEDATSIEQLRGRHITVNLRRMNQQDVQFEEEVSRHYLCTGVPMRKQLTEWLSGKELVFEDFNF
ncbi:putative pyridoxamine 5'-phosphate oxidase, FMN-binding split barrel [Septoria linicola]|nr:putative pyridoxamine 5'-phosphate oxidase, FMN-binding split barrel [Septoria linicola]